MVILVHIRILCLLFGFPQREQLTTSFIPPGCNIRFLLFRILCLEKDFFLFGAASNNFPKWSKIIGVVGTKLFERKLIYTKEKKLFDARTGNCFYTSL